MEIPDELVGARVALRHRIGERDGRPLFTDAVGELSAEGSRAVVVRTRRGPVRVERSAVVAVRAVPPAPPRRAPLAAIVRLEGLCADAWPAEVERPLGAWRLRAAGGYTGRANAALALGDPGLPIAAALDEVRRFAREHRVPPRVHVPVGSPWDRAVAGEGWVLNVGHAKGAEVSVLVAPVPDVEPDRAAPPGLRIELPTRPPADWWPLAVGGPPTPAQERVLAGAPGTAFGTLRDPGGGVLGQVRATVVDDHVHVSMLEVVPAARRRGHATALLASAAAWGRERGARWAVLQVALQNDGARALYDRLGYVEHHRYRYLVPPT
ncbi:acetyltransferase (GNAT) family protein [Pseudonocardia hierapolitana]|uniref:Acetyltransferase (GNAT) family protein n=1 Tax=Pseudonocardia hierapolitana TaxID=1128676 RepID=A0A561SNE5_9PSEU|nr:GNAT family N-acetyltransferase [Pseudonocardia hierapolitana]TWF76383.1 acetyltransferase (GNAT) family protein [Pseudonocardia hierapolitana]